MSMKQLNPFNIQWLTTVCPGSSDLLYSKNGSLLPGHTVLLGASEVSANLCCNSRICIGCVIICVTYGAHVISTRSSYPFYIVAYYTKWVTILGYTVFLIYPGQVYYYFINIFQDFRCSSHDLYYCMSILYIVTEIGQDFFIDIVVSTFMLRAYSY